MSLSKWLVEDARLRERSHPDCSQIYCVEPPRPSNVCVVSMQIRAAHLVAALWEERRLTKRQTVHVVGGGVTGCTAAVVAWNLGARQVCVYEQSEELVPLLSAATHRYLHPRMYLWPDKASAHHDWLPAPLRWWAKDGTASSPPMVQASIAAERIRTSMIGLANGSGGEFRLLVGKTPEGDGCLNGLDDLMGRIAQLRSLRLRTRHSGDLDEHLVLLCLGLPPEKGQPGHSRGYWDLGSSPGKLGQSSPVVIAGGGDGGITDLVDLTFARSRSDLVRPASAELSEWILRAENLPSSPRVESPTAQPYAHILRDLAMLLSSFELMESSCRKNIERQFHSAITARSETGLSLDAMRLLELVRALPRPFDVLSQVSSATPQATAPVEAGKVIIHAPEVITKASTNLLNRVLFAWAIEDMIKHHRVEWHSNRHEEATPLPARAELLPRTGLDESADPLGAFTPRATVDGQAKSNARGGRFATPIRLQSRYARLINCERGDLVTIPGLDVRFVKLPGKYTSEHTYMADFFLTCVDLQRLGLSLTEPSVYWPDSPARFTSASAVHAALKALRSYLTAADALSAGAVEALDLRIPSPADVQARCCDDEQLQYSADGIGRPPRYSEVCEGRNTQGFVGMVGVLRHVASTDSGLLASGRDWVTQPLGGWPVDIPLAASGQWRSPTLGLRPVLVLEPLL